MGRRNCYKKCEPEVDNTGILCDGDFVSQECVVLNKNPYFGIVEGDFLTKFINIVQQKFKSITIALSRKIDYSTLETFANDADAAQGGILVGKPYKTIDGFVKIRVI